MAGSTTPPNAGRTPRKTEPRRKAGEQSPPRLEERTREELYELAGELGIAGRADMSRSELLEAIRRR